MHYSSVYYLLKLNPAPRSVSVRKHNHNTDFVWVCPARSPCRLAIHYLQTGSIRDIRENDICDIAAGTAYAFPLGDRVRQELLPPVVEYMMQIYLCEEPIELTAEEVADRSVAIHEAIVPGMVMDPDSARKVGNHIVAAMLDAPQGDPLRSLKLRTHMYSMLTLLSNCSIVQARRQLQLQVSAWSRQTKKAIAYIEEHLAERMSVGSIAAAAGVNYDYLKNVFRCDVGMTLVEYINDRRIQRAKELLASPDMSSEEAGGAIGIQDTKYLGRLFRRYTGMTITEYRKFCRESQEL